jgi:hypothetical protein
MEYIGKKFYDYYDENKKIVISKFNNEKYLIININDIEKHNQGIYTENSLYSENEIKNFLNNQDKILKVMNDNIEFNKKQEEREEKEQIRKLEEEKIYNNVYGFCDNMKPIEKGKVLKILNKKFRYKEFGIKTRKEFLLLALKKGYRLDKKENFYCNDKFVPIEYRLYDNSENNAYHQLFKTEYLYCEHLIKNKII